MSHAHVSRSRISRLGLLSILLGCCAGLLQGVATAEVPRLLSYQGRLAEPDGTPLVGPHTLTLRLYDASAGGSLLWEETHAVTIERTDRGVFSVILGAVTPLSSSLDFNRALWLTTEVDGTGELAPRQQLTAVSYAINAQAISGLPASAFARTDHTHEGLTPGQSIGTGPGQIVQLDAGGALPAVSGANLTQLNASVLASGTMPIERLPDHVHEGVHSLGIQGGTPLVNDVELAAGSNVTLSQSGQTLTIAAGAPSAAGNRVSSAASSALGIATGSETTLLSATIAKSQAGSALLVLATVQLQHTANPNDKTVDLKLFRDGSQLDTTYQARIGTANRTVSELPVTLQAWDTSGAGTYTFSLRARSSGAGAQATVRRLTVLELP